MRPPYDVARCDGESQLGVCPRRDGCARYCQRNNIGRNTPTHDRMCTGMGGAWLNYIRQEPRKLAIANQEAQDGR